MVFDVLFKGLEARFEDGLVTARVDIDANEGVAAGGVFDMIGVNGGVGVGVIIDIAVVG